MKEGGSWEEWEERGLGCCDKLEAKLTSSSGFINVELPFVHPQKKKEKKALEIKVHLLPGRLNGSFLRTECGHLCHSRRFPARKAQVGIMSFNKNCIPLSILLL